MSGILGGGMFVRKLLPVVLLVISLPARGENIEAAREHYVQGSKDFDLGLYDQAIKEYMAAYDAKPDPALLYNIAQAHKLAGHPSEAIRFYRVYLVRVPDAPNADEVRAKIAELQKAVEQQRKAQSMPPDQTKPLGSVGSTAGEAEAAPPPSTPPPSAAPSSTPPPTSAPLMTERTDQRGNRTMKIAGVSVAALGVAALATGVGLAVAAKRDSDQLTTLAQQNGVFDPSKDSSGRTLGTAGPVLIGVGAALVVAGGVVAILGWRSGRSSHTASASTNAAVHF
jgi:tetratricopeptide (TPR) repeat protein